jgi:hypothetical protein
MPGAEEAIADPVMTDTVLLEPALGSGQLQVNVAYRRVVEPPFGRPHGAVTQAHHPPAIVTASLHGSGQPAFSARAMIRCSAITNRATRGSSADQNGGPCRSFCTLGSISQGCALVVKMSIAAR